MNDTSDLTQIKPGRALGDHQEHLFRGAEITSLREFIARAELCRHFAKLEPQTSPIWLAEAERWSRLTREPCNAVVAARYEFFQNIESADR